MGANFCERTYNTPDYNKALKEFNSDCEMSLMEDGNTYSGCIGMFPGAENTHIEFGSYDEAVEWLQENQDKWENAKAVKFRDGKMTNSSEKQQEKLRTASSDAYNNLIELKSKFSAEIRNQKSKTKACKSCSSKVNKSYIKQGICPVCGETMLSETQKKRIFALEKKSQDAQIKRNNFKPKFANAKLIWMFGGWCSS